MEKLDLIVLTGRFAAGKDTQADKLTKKFGESSEIISTGDIYRSAKTGEGEYAKYHFLLEPYIEDVDKRGLLIPDRVITQIVQEVIDEEIDKGKETFIFTGFPRTIGQLECFDDMVATFKKESIVDCIFIEYIISDETTKERSRNRLVEALKHGNQVREEDKPETVEKRINTYHKDIEPMIEKLRAEGRLITIDGSRTIPEIEAETSIKLSKER